MFLFTTLVTRTKENIEFTDILSYFFKKVNREQSVRQNFFTIKRKFMILYLVLQAVTPLKKAQLVSIDITKMSKGVEKILAICLKSKSINLVYLAF